jgi:hypothetical protein
MGRPVKRTVRQKISAAAAAKVAAASKAKTHPGDWRPLRKRLPPGVKYYYRV